MFPFPSSTKTMKLKLSQDTTCFKIFTLINKTNTKYEDKIFCHALVIGEHHKNTKVHT